MSQHPHPIIVLWQCHLSFCCKRIENIVHAYFLPKSKVGAHGPWVHVLSSPNVVCCAIICFLFSVLSALSSSVFVLLGQLLIFVWCRDPGNFGFYLICLQVLHLHFLHKKGKNQHHFCKEMVFSTALIHLLKFSSNNTVWEKEVKMENVLVQFLFRMELCLLAVVVGSFAHFSTIIIIY